MQFELFPWVHIVRYIKLQGMKRIFFLFHGGMKKKKKTLITLYETPSDFFFHTSMKQKKFSSFLSWYLVFVQKVFYRIVISKFNLTNNLRYFTLQYTTPH